MGNRTARLVMNGPKLVVSKPAEKALNSRQNVRAATIAWVVAAVYYFYQYVLGSAPSVMMP